MGSGPAQGRRRPLVPLLGLAPTSSRSTASKIAFEDGKLIYKGNADAAASSLHPDEHGWERFGQDHSGLLANGQPTRPYRRRRVDDQARRPLLSAVRSARHRVQRLRQRHLCRRTSRSVRSNMRTTIPIAYKPGGFVHGAGHGSTFQDAHGNWWNTGTPWIGYNWTFERRIDMFPAQVRGRRAVVLVLVALRRFPALYADDEGRAIRTACSPAGCCLSYRKAATASSTHGRVRRRQSDRRGSAHFLGRRSEPAGRDADARSRQDRYGARGAGQFRRLSSPAASPTRPTSTPSSSCKARSTGRPGSRWRAPSRRGAIGPTPISSCRSRCARASSATCMGTSARRTSRSATCACSAMPVGRRRQLRAKSGGSRHSDQRDATIRWARVPGAVGYNIRFGIRPDRLTQTYQLWADELGNDATLEQGVALAQ